MNLKVQFALENDTVKVGSLTRFPKFCFNHAVEVADMGHQIAARVDDADTVDSEGCHLCGATMHHTADDVFRVTPDALRQALEEQA